MEILSELNSRFVKKGPIDRIKTSADAARIFSPIASREQEHFAVLTLTASGGVIGFHLVAPGTADRVATHPRDVFRHEIKDNAVTIIVDHNHPSGDLEPSDNDKEFHFRLCRCGVDIGIPVVDHFIVTATAACSFSGNGIKPENIAIP